MITIRYDEGEDIVVLTHENGQNVYVQLDEGTKQMKYIIDWLAGVRGVGGIAERYFYQLQQFELDSMVRAANGGYDIPDPLYSIERAKPWDDDSNCQEYYDPRNN